MSITAQKINKRITLIQKDFGWNGTYSGPAIIVNKGDLVQLVVINRGNMAHNFGIGVLSKQVMDLINTENNVSLDKRLKYIPYSMMTVMPCPGCHEEFKE